MPRKNKQPPKPSVAPTNSWVYTTEGITYSIDWDKFPLNGFVFIRCIETTNITQSLRANASKHGIKLMIQIGIRNGYWGVGVWRIK